MSKFKTLWLIVSVIALLTFGATLIRAVFYEPDINGNKIPTPANAISAIETSVPTDADPLRLTVPVLGIDAQIQQVGVTKSGNMATPTNFTDVGWYKFGTRPGEEGSAVIAGHRSNAVFLPAVFYPLKDIQKGDDIYVFTEDGSTLHFTVTTIATYDYQKVPTDILFNETGNRYLKLITCAGAWHSDIKTADKRLIITSVLVQN